MCPWCRILNLVKEEREQESSKTPAAEALDWIMEFQIKFTKTRHFSLNEQVTGKDAEFAEL